MRKILIGLLGYTFASQQMLAQTDSIADTRELKAVVVKATNGIKSRFRVDNAEIIGQGQLIRAACCNLGESFTANPSVDVSYSDAATGAKQIKLLGLSGTYVQMLTENVPNLRGAALPYSLGYVPGPWMQSIQVSKGASEERIRKHNGTDKHRVSEAARHRWRACECLSGQRTENGGEPRRKRSSQRTPFYRNTSTLREPTDGSRRQRRRFHGYAEAAPV